MGRTRKILLRLIAVASFLGVLSPIAFPMPVKAITLTEYPSPVFSTLIPDQAYVIKDNVNYKLYYAGNDFASINLAQSPDGVRWTTYPGNPIISDAQYHADVKYYDTGFPGANTGSDPSLATMNYRMWYQGLSGYSIAGWRYAESPDGIHWYNRMAVSQDPAGPLVFSSHAGVNYGIADAVYTPGATNSGTDWTFRIYANLQWEDPPYGGKELTVMAFSANGYVWRGYDPGSVGYATPVFGPSLVDGTFDRDHVGWFKVIKNSPTDWEAFYSGGGNDTTYQALNGIGYATSTDGMNWTRAQTLFTTSDGVAWRSQSVWMPSVVKDGSNYQIWFLGSDNPSIGGSDWIQFRLGGAGLHLSSGNPTDPVGAVRSSYYQRENVWCGGSGFFPNSDVDVYIVDYVDTWSEGMSIPTPRYGSTPVTVHIGPDGSLPLTEIWTSRLTPGHYEAFFDANQDGQYESGVDVDPPFWVYPDPTPTSTPVFPSVYIGIGAAMGAGVAAFLVSRRLARQ